MWYPGAHRAIVGVAFYSSTVLNPKLTAVSFFANAHVVRESIKVIMSVVLSRLARVHEDGIGYAAALPGKLLGFGQTITLPKPVKVKEGMSWKRRKQQRGDYEF